MHTKKLSELLAASGISSRWSLHFFITAKKIGCGVVLTFAAFIFYSDNFSLFSGTFSSISILFLLYSAVYWPEIYLKSLGEERRVSIENDLPFFVDSLILYLTAGLNIEEAVRNFTKYSNSALTQEFKRLILYIDHGVDFKEAFKRMCTTISSPEVKQLSEILEQSRTTGAPLTEVIRAYATRLRLHKRLRAEEYIQKISFKLSFPLILLIFPAFLILFLGPPIIYLHQFFVSM